MSPRNFVVLGPTTGNQRNRQKPSCAEHYALAFIKCFDCAPAPCDEPADVSQERHKAAGGDDANLELRRQHRGRDVVEEPLERGGDNSCAFRRFEGFTVQDYKDWWGQI